MLSLTSSVISAGIVVSASLITFMPSCSPSACSTCSSFTRPIRTATLPRSSLPDRFCSSRTFQRAVLVEVAHVDHDRAESSRHA